MQALNKARVALKHHGTMPDRKEVTDFSSRVEGFFENVLRDFCDLDYHEVSYLDLLGDALVRDLINKACEAFEAGNKSDAMICLAFAKTRIEHPDDMYLPVLSSPPPPRLLGDLDNQANREVIRQVYGYFGQIASAINALTVGIDTEQRTWFNRWAPGILWSMNGTPHIQFNVAVDYKSLSRDIFESLLSFVVDYGIRASELYIPFPGRKSHLQYTLK